MAFNLQEILRKEFFRNLKGKIISKKMIKPFEKDIHNAKNTRLKETLAYYDKDALNRELTLSSALVLERLVGAAWESVS